MGLLLYSVVVLVLVLAPLSAIFFPAVYLADDSTGKLPPSKPITSRVVTRMPSSQQPPWECLPDWELNPRELQISEELLRSTESRERKMTRSEIMREQAEQMMLFRAQTGLL